MTGPTVGLIDDRHNPDRQADLSATRRNHCRCRSSVLMMGLLGELSAHFSLDQRHFSASAIPGSATDFDEFMQVSWRSVYATALAEDRRGQPPRHLTSSLVEAEVDASGCRWRRPRRSSSWCWHETTRNAITPRRAGIVLAILSNGQVVSD